MSGPPDRESPGSSSSTPTPINERRSGRGISSLLSRPLQSPGRRPTLSQMASSVPPRPPSEVQGTSSMSSSWIPQTTLPAAVTRTPSRLVPPCVRPLILTVGPVINTDDVHETPHVGTEQAQAPPSPDSVTEADPIVGAEHAEENIDDTSGSSSAPPPAPPTSPELVSAVDAGDPTLLEEGTTSEHGHRLSSSSSRRAQPPSPTESITVVDSAPPAEEVPLISDHVVGDDDDIACWVCLEDFEAGEHVKGLPCQHKFHNRCIVPWFAEGHNSCPACRRRLNGGPPSPNRGGRGRGRGGRGAATWGGGLAALRGAARGEGGVGAGGRGGVGVGDRGRGGGRGAGGRVGRGARRRAHPCCGIDQILNAIKF